MITWLSISVKRIFGIIYCGLHPRDYELSRIKSVLGFMGGGVYKRIDENRELLELLQHQAPDFLASHSWVEGWLAANDEFFLALASTLPITEGQFLGEALTRPDKFPRPWPGKPYALAHISGEEDVAKGAEK